MKWCYNLHTIKSLTYEEGIQYLVYMLMCVAKKLQAGKYIHLWNKHGKATIRISKRQNKQSTEKIYMRCNG